MRRLVFAAVFVSCAAGSASAQPDRPLSPLALAVACAPPPTFDAPEAPLLRILGSQDSTARSLFGDRDLLVVGGGTSSGVQLGQQFFIRRAISSGTSRATRGARTHGWLRVVAVNETTAIAIVDHVCNAIVTTDYLEPFAAPVVSADFERDETPGQPDFSTLGHIVAGNEDRATVGAGDFALIDGGQAQGLEPGARFAIYRDIGVSGMPLASVGEGVVVSTSHKMALMRVTRARDAVFSGDYIA